MVGIDDLSFISIGILSKSSASAQLTQFHLIIIEIGNRIKFNMETTFADVHQEEITVDGKNRIMSGL